MYYDVESTSADSFSRLRLVSYYVNSHDTTTLATVFNSKFCFWKYFIDAAPTLDTTGSVRTVEPGFCRWNSKFPLFLQLPFSSFRDLVSFSRRPKSRDLISLSH